MNGPALNDDGSVKGCAPQLCACGCGELAAISHGHANRFVRGHARRGVVLSADLHAHHIKRFAEYVDLRFVVANGQTLCAGHHFLVHHKGRRLNG